METAVEAPQRGINNMAGIAISEGEEHCSGFPNEKCDDMDLLTVAHKIADHCEYVNIDEICRGLGLKESTAQEVERQHERSSYGDVIHELLLRWKVKAVTAAASQAVTADAEATAGESVTTGAEAGVTTEDTWAYLMPLLRSIFSSEPLMKALSDYFSQKVNPDPEEVGKFVEDVCFLETRQADYQTFSEASQPLTDLSPSNYMQAQQASDDHDERIAIHQLVVGNTLISPEVDINVDVKRRMEKEQEKFADLLVTAWKKLHILGMTPDEIGIYLTQLSVQKMETKPLLFDEHMAGIICKKSLSQMFMFLSRVGAWGFLNFHLLSRIANRYGDEDLKSKVEEYGKGIASFMEETKFEDYLRVYTSRVPFGFFPGCKPLIVKLEEEWGSFTLAKVAERQGDLEAQFHLEPYIFKLCNGGQKCVMVMWLIPSSAVSVIKDAIRKKRVNFRGSKISELIVGEYRFIFKPEVHTPTCVPALPTSDSLQPEDQDVKSKCIPAGDDVLEQLMKADYTKTYEESIQDPAKFWGELARKCLHWEKPFDREKVMHCNMKEGKIEWFVGGKLNVSVNCLDRHVKTHPERIALIWEKDDHEKDEPKQDEKVTYRELLHMTCRIANVLKRNNVKKGDTVVIYMPVAPITVASMLACARIGAIHSVIFTSVKEQVLTKMIKKAQAKAVITANQRSLKNGVDKAVERVKEVEVVFVASISKGPLGSQHTRDIPLEKAMEKESTECPPESMNSEDTLFIMYTSGTSDEPRGIVHTQAGYLLYAAVTHKCVFNYKPGEVFACVAGLCWITGHSYVVYGPLCNGGTTVLFGSTSRPNLPKIAADRYLKMIGRLEVNHFYTSPATVRLLMKAGTNLVQKDDLKTIGSVGECLSAGAWEWYNKFIGKEQCTVVDTWWQTEIGGIAITPHPAPSGSRPKPGFQMKPFFGVEPVIVDDKGKILEGPDVTGYLCLKKPLPGMGRDILGDTQKYKKDYFQCYPGFYFTYDVAYRDADGDYKIIGRKSDITPGLINGHWISKDVPEIENDVNLSDSRVLESSVVPCAAKETVKYKVFIQLIEEGVSETEKLQVIAAIEEALVHSPHVVPQSRRHYTFVRQQPKTHSGKINRHTLKAVASRIDDNATSDVLETVDIEELHVAVPQAELGH